MKSIHRILIAGLALLGAARLASASDQTGRFGISYTVGPSFILGNSRATDASSVEPGIGAALHLGLSRNLDVQMAYDYVDATLHSQAITFGGLWRFQPEGAWMPFAGAGLGFGKPGIGQGWDHVSLKLTGGLEHPLTEDISLAPVMSYQYIDGADSDDNIHVWEPGIRLLYYFGNLPKK